VINSLKANRRIGERYVSKRDSHGGG
jgi:hypothetical protein